MIKVFNPFFLYIYAFLFVLLLYSLHWSILQPRLSIELLLFLVSTFVISIILGIHIQKCRSSYFSNPFGVNLNYKRRVKVLLFFYLLEFAYVHKIPIISLFISSDRFEHFGGIPTFHVFLVTYTVFFSTFLFHRLICNFNRILLLYFLYISLLPPILMVNRGMLFTIFFACLFVFLFSLKSLSVRKILYCIGGVSIALYLFTMIGSARINDNDDSRIFTSFTQPSENFEALNISNMFLWPYMYITSPLANLQTCIESYTPENSFSGFFLNCICPDFIAKRIDNEDEKELPQISPVFNVSTMYSGVYAKMGFLGMYMLYFVQTLYLYVIFLFSRPTNNPYYTATVSLICSVVVLNTFTNMWVFSAISFPIVWGPISYFLSKVKWLR